MIVCGFPGVGKTHCHRLYPDITADSDSSRYSWLAHGGRNPDFPANYIRRIKRLSLVRPFVFVSSHQEVRDALQQAGMKFTVVYPDKSSKRVFLERYVNRGSSPMFIQLMADNFDTWVDKLDNASRTGEVEYVKADSLLDVMVAWLADMDMPNYLWKRRGNR